MRVDGGTAQAMERLLASPDFKTVVKYLHQRREVEVRALLICEQAHLVDLHRGRAQFITDLLDTLQGSPEQVRKQERKP